jgi:hypothetical protein
MKPLHCRYPGGIRQPSDLRDWTRGHLTESGLVVRVIGSHEPVPDVEVEAVVPSHLLVMHDMVGRGVEDQP